MDRKAGWAKVESGIMESMASLTEDSATAGGDQGGVRRRDAAGVEAAGAHLTEAQATPHGGGSPAQLPGTVTELAEEPQIEPKAALSRLGLDDTELTETKLVSPAQAEKALKKRKIDMPEGLITAVSSGDTLAPADDPRPASLQIGRQLSAALGKLV